MTTLQRVSIWIGTETFSIPSLNNELNNFTNTWNNHDSGTSKWTAIKTSGNLTVDGNTTTTGNTVTTGTTTVTGGIIGVTNASDATAGNVGESLRAVVTASTNVATTTQYGDATSLSITAGDWLCFGMVYIDLNTSANLSLLHVGISTTTGNSSAGLVLGDNLTEVFNGAATWAYNTSGQINGFRVNVSSTTTHYLKLRVDYPGGQPKYKCRFNALRIR